MSSKFLDAMKMLAVKLFLPVLVGEGETALHDYLLGLSKTHPKKFAVMLQSMYPTFKGVLQPLTNSTKTPLDNTAVDPTVEMLETLMEELNIPIPVVIPIDFDSPDDEVVPVV